MQYPSVQTSKQCYNKFLLVIFVITSPLPTEFLTHTCENITFPQLRLRTVKIITQITLILSFPDISKINLIELIKGLIARAATNATNFQCTSSGSRGGPRGPWPPPGPVKIGHKKDGRRRQPHRFHVSRPPLTRPLDPLLV